MLRLVHCGCCNSAMDHFYKYICSFVMYGYYGTVALKDKQRKCTLNDDNNIEPGYQLTITHERMNVVR